MPPSTSLDRLLAKPPELMTLSRALHGVSIQRESFRMPDRWALHFYDYDGALTIAPAVGHATGRSVFRLQPGSASLTPVGMQAEYVYEGPSRHIYAHFRLPRGRRAEPQFWEPDPRVTGLRHLLESALPFRETDPRRASARLWDVLLGLTSLKRQPSFRSEEDRIMEMAIHHIESDIGNQLRIADIAHRCGISLNTLARIFHRQIGQSPVAYLRKCRVSRALELLLHSDLPIKAIAFSVGLPDLHHFNKILRKETGRSPRAWRAPEG